MLSRGLEVPPAKLLYPPGSLVKATGDLEAAEDPGAGLVPLEASDVSRKAGKALAATDGHRTIANSGSRSDQVVTQYCLRRRGKNQKKGNA